MKVEADELAAKLTDRIGEFDRIQEETARLLKDNEETIEVIYVSWFLL